MTPRQVRQANYGPWEFHTEKWELAYIKRVDTTITALKSARVPVLWVGLPSQRGTKASHKDFENVLLPGLSCGFPSAIRDQFLNHW